MGISAYDELRDEKLDALALQIRHLTETIQANQVDLAAAWIAILALQAQVDDKVSAAQVASLGELNAQVSEARRQLADASAAASENWATLQIGVRESFEVIRTNVREASERIRQD